MSDVHVNGGKAPDFPRELVEAAVRHALRAEGAAGAEVSVTFVDDDAIRELNRRHLGRDRVTDVIAFRLEGGGAADAGSDGRTDGRTNAGPGRTDDGPGGGPGDPESRPDAAGGPPSLVGDVYIGLPQAERQAAERSIPPAEELARLAIHGTLHVLGHDHPEDGSREESPFFRRQEALLAEVVASSPGAPRGPVGP